MNLQIHAVEGLLRLGFAQCEKFAAANSSKKSIFRKIEIERSQV